MSLLCSHVCWKDEVPGFLDSALWIFAVEAFKKFDFLVVVSVEVFSLLRPFVKDLEALVKWMNEFQNQLAHIQIYSSTILITCKTFLDIVLQWIKLIVYRYQL